jgi:hypothetical protein
MNIVIAMLVVALFGGTFWIVVAYNKTVDLSHDIASAKTKLDTIGANSTALSNNIVATLGSGDIATIAAQNNLVQDKKPQYFPIDQKWPIASQ